MFPSPSKQREKVMLANVLKSSLIVAAIAAGYAHAQISDNRDGYLTSGAQEPVRSAYGDCWRTGYWTEERASRECDPQLAVKETPKAPAMPAPEVPQRASYSAEVLFEFERAELGAEGRKLLDDLAHKLVAIDPEKVTATAHADRIGRAEYNERLSARRAEAIRVYLVEKGVPEKLLHFESKGAREPVSACETMGPETKHNAKLVACLQPDRRVEIEVAGRQKP
jgi:OOP family OmpA-OmpF porin